MKADPFQIGDVLKDRKRLVVPIYQRTYAWTEVNQLRRFFTSVDAKARERLEAVQPSFPHYMGAILLSPRGKFSFGAIPVFDVVDGQQRLMTFQIFLSAMCDLARELESIKLAEQLETFLVNSPTPMMRDPKVERYKLQPTTYDRALARDLIDLRRDQLRERYPNAFYKKGTIRNDAPLALAAWWYFRSEALQFIQSDTGTDSVERLSALSAALLEDFRVIVITLDESDDAQVIFETLNAGGEPLAAMDLVRNDVFHRAARSEEDPDTLMERRWSTFEEPFWKRIATQGRIKKPRIDFFLAHTLTAETGKEVLLTELYARYKSFVATKKFANVDAELEALIRYAPVYRALAEPTSGGRFGLSHVARQLEIFDVSTAYPLLFVIANSAAEDDEKEYLYSLISSYIVRRALCGLTAKAYNNTFVRIAAHLKSQGVSRATFASVFAGSTGETVRFPTDDELVAALRARSQYNAMPVARLRYILEELEGAAHDRFDETLGLRGDLTIEHVLPDAWPEHWLLPDGSRAPADAIVSSEDPRHPMIARRQILKHSLGNLTLLTPSGNPRLSNLPFTVADPTLGLSKREAFRTSLLKMNQEIAVNERWGETEIETRASILAARAVTLWPYPAA